MNLFKYYRIALVLSFLILLAGSMLKVTHSQVGFLNGNNTLIAGLAASVVTVVLAFYMIWKSSQMVVGEKLIWVLLFSLGFLLKVGLIVLLVGIVFFFIGPKRLFLSEHNSGPEKQ